MPGSPNKYLSSVQNLSPIPHSPQQFVFLSPHSTFSTPGSLQNLSLASGLSSSPVTPTSSERKKHFSCEICGKNYNHQSGLSRHRKVHLDDEEQKLNLGKEEEKSLFAELSSVRKRLNLKKRQLDREKAEEEKLDQKLKNIRQRKIRKRRKLHLLEQNLVRRPYGELSSKGKHRRRKKVVDFARTVFGENSLFMGLQDCVTSTDQRTLKKLFGKSSKWQKVASESVKKIRKEKIKKFQAEGNEKQTIQTLLGGARLMSLQDYRFHQRSSRKIAKQAEIEIPRMSDYCQTRRQLFLKCQIVQELTPVSTLVPSSHVQGYYRNLQGALICLAQKLLINGEFQWIKPNVLHWKVAGDGGPCGHRELTDYTVTLIEFGSRVHQPSNNLLLFSAFVKEDSAECLAFNNLFAKEAIALEGKQLEIHYESSQEKVEKTEMVRFCRGRFGGDQKFLAVSLGELNNAASYFTSFCLASKKELLMDGYLGDMEDPDAKWYPISNGVREEHAKLVAQEIEEFKRKHGKEPSRDHITGKICGEKIKTRILGKSTIGGISSSIELCFLHVGLTIWFNWYKDVLFNILLPLSGSQGEKVSSLPDNHPFKVFAEVTRSSGMNQLFRRIEKMWNKAEAGGPTLNYKFRGEEVKGLSLNFPAMLNSLLPAIATQSGSKRSSFLKLVCFFLKLGILLQKITSLASRTSVTEEDIKV